MNKECSRCGCPDLYKSRPNQTICRGCGLIVTRFKPVPKEIADKCKSPFEFISHLREE